MKVKCVKIFEEMQSTQKEMIRVKADIERKEAILMSLVNASKDTYFCIDKEYRVLVANEALQKRVKASGEELKVGQLIFDNFDESQIKHWKTIYDKILNGTSFVEDLERKVGNDILYLQASYEPIRNKQHEIIGASVISKDVTRSVKNQMRLKVLEDKFKNE